MIKLKQDLDIDILKPLTTDVSSCKFCAQYHDKFCHKFLIFTSIEHNCRTLSYKYLVAIKEHLKYNGMLCYYSCRYFRFPFPSNFGNCTLFDKNLKGK